MVQTPDGLALLQAPKHIDIDCDWQLSLTSGPKITVKSIAISGLV